MDRIVHFNGDTENDEAFCGQPVLGGGDYDIEKVTCLDCLQQIQELGNKARMRLNVIHNLKL
jgi:hypothetical protein